MFSQDDDNTGVVIGVLFGVLALVISLVIGVSIYAKNQTALNAKPAALATATAAAAPSAAGALGAAATGSTDASMLAAAQLAADAASVKVEGGVVKFFFASGKFELASGGPQALADIIAGVKAGKKAAVSGYVDSTGNADKNKEIAKLRAFAVRDLLQASGVPASSIELKKPENIKAGTGAQARRVEVTLQ